MTAAATALNERTAPYLRPNQVESMKTEQLRQQAMLNSPPHIRGAVDVSLARTTLQRISQQLETDTPKAYAEGERDDAVKVEKQLREEWLAGMPTAAEMRKAPPGALEKHMSWERRNSEKIDRWKNIRLRMAQSGMLPSEYEGSAICNIEMYRPQGGPTELPMDGAFIPGKQFSLGKNDSSVITDREIALLKIFAPELVEKLALLSGDERRDVKDAVATLSTKEQIDALDMKELRDRCRAAELETGGAKDECRSRLYELYGVAKDA